MIAGMIGAGALMLSVVGMLFKVNHDFCTRNEKKIDDNQEKWHAIDKKLDILIDTLAIKYPNAMKQAKKDNGDSR